METPRVYVGTYRKYNNGSIKGEWLDLDDYSDHAEFMEACYELHADEHDPELMFQDHECDIAGLISESSVNPKLWDILELEDHEILQVKAFMHQYSDIDYALEHYEDCSVTECEYEHEAKETYFETWCERNYDIVELLEARSALSYLDTDRIWNDARYSNVHFIKGIGIVDFYV